MAKQKIDWLFNQPQARKAVSIIGARNLTIVKAVTFESGEEKDHFNYDKMIQYDSQQADMELILWMKKIKEQMLNAEIEEYVYFRFQRLN